MSDFHLTLVIPTLNRAPILADLLDSISKLDPVSFRWECLVIDNGSTDTTANTVQEKQKQFPHLAIRYLHEPKQGLHNCRNRAALASRASVLGYLDDDMYLEPSWLEGVLRLDNGVGWVGGPVLPYWETPTLPPWLSHFWNPESGVNVFPYLGLIDLGGKEQPVPPSYVFGGNCVIFRETVLAMGGFHPDGFPSAYAMFRGDGESGFASKFAASGGRALYCPKMKVYHRIGAERLTPDYLARRAYNEGLSESYAEARTWGRRGRGSDRPALRRALSLLRRSLESRIRQWRYPQCTASRLLGKLEASQRRGYRDHKKSLSHSPALRRWVQLPDYLSFPEPPDVLREGEHG